MPEEKELGAVEVREGQRPRGMGSVVPIPEVMPELLCSMDGGYFLGVRLSLGCVPVRMLRTARGSIDPIAP